MNRDAIMVGSVTEYMVAVEQHSLNLYISRGENRYFPNIIASAFRPYVDYEKKNKWYNKKHVEHLINHFIGDLTPVQQNHILAFAQHSGLPTNLIDFSFMPLVSLFFACYYEQGYRSKLYFHLPIAL